MKRVMVTGSRHWTDEGAVIRALRAAQDQLGAFVLVHGACPTGADEIAADFWGRRGPVEAHPADWAQHGKAAGPIRNKEMVESGIDLVIAFPLPDSKGTRNAMALAHAAGIQIWVCG